MKTRLTLFLIVLASAITLGYAAPSSDYQPTTTWPYVFEDFQKGELQMIGSKVKEGMFNIHIRFGKLHYIDGETVKEAAVKDVYSVKIGQSIYANVQGKMMRVLAKNDKGLVVEEELIDMVRLNSTGGAYGSSSNTMATTALSSLDQVDNSGTAMNHMAMSTRKEDGKILPTTKKVYMFFDGNLVFATKKEINAIEGVDGKGLKAFFKENKIKLKDNESLLKLIDFLAK